MAVSVQVKMANGEVLDGFESIRYPDGHSDIFVVANLKAGRQAGYVKARWSRIDLLWHAA